MFYGSDAVKYEGKNLKCNKELSNTVTHQRKVIGITQMPKLRSIVMQSNCQKRFQAVAKETQ